MLEDKWALVVEDDAHSLVAISAILRDLGVQFKRNTTGANVPEQMRAMNPPPDFVLLNIDLPRGDAFVINKLIQSDPVVSGIPVIALGSIEDALALHHQVKRSGFASFITKPLPRRSIENLLQRVLSGEYVWEAVS